MAPFPHPAHRTGQADFPHPDKTSRFRVQRHLQLLDIYWRGREGSIFAPSILSWSFGQDVILVATSSKSEEHRREAEVNRRKAGEAEASARVAKDYATQTAYLKL